MIELHRNVHMLDSDEISSQWLLMSDIHWDNPHCDRELLRAHLDKALAANIPVLINGDFFCLMQGKFDPRRSKENVRPEHNVNNYLDAVIKSAVEWFAPYKSILRLLGYGNHETSIVRNCETDPLQRFVDLFNATHGTELMTGGYGGWILLKMRDYTYKIKYFHGSGGGGPVTKGVIQNQRRMAMHEGMDCIWMGHVHEMYTMYHTIESLNRKWRPVLKNVLHIRTPSYKEEYDGGYMDFHVERGRPPKPMGCYMLQVDRNTHTHELTAAATPWQ
ncbi:MAG: hypothetical protein Unbinned1529contig1001_22 [Prokaryotic dsDNA virus sp.]|nr:MAG: hypothetical protein Unbinned1529contig1001_22 [Prokaryotic dsDNA virus sp.]|tara:strand:+ start:8061 stop:8885 length:825 start_codon:yes stop_codon:yes gene_type:complete